VYKECQVVKEMSLNLLAVVFSGTNTAAIYVFSLKLATLLHYF
jgi:hypothetical protein